jgi:deoxycytidylate deaminase
LPGEKEAPGKLLDMCRALHAEENAILGLSGISKTGDGKLILVTTTFPCNLCANKIVAAGIKTVYYAEPYTMKEAVEILSKCKVEPIKFQGIKSSAYFRLYG